jgi:L,D-transpeptidase catalytic domain
MSHINRSKFAAALLVSLLGVVSGQNEAFAQATFFDWSEPKKEKGSGKQTVSFNTSAKPGDVIVSFGDRRLYYITKTGEALSYPVAIPREQDRWQGEIRVSSKREKPSWTPTPSMRAENPRLPTWVPGGHPMNPLGTYALYLGDSMYRIHGTDAPWTIGTAVSKGCVRMYNQDAADLYPRVKVGAKVLVTWQKFSTSADQSAAIAAPVVQPPSSATATPPKALPSTATTAATAPNPTEKPNSGVVTGSLPHTTDAEPVKRRRSPATARTTPKSAPHAPEKAIKTLEIVSI